MPAHDWFIIFVPTGILLALPILFYGRRRALRARGPWPDRSLNVAELEYVKAWQTRSVAGFILVLTGWLTWTVLLMFTIGDSALGAWLWGFSMIGVAALAICFQYTPRCPRCEYRLGYQTRLGVPARCERCGVALR